MPVKLISREIIHVANPRVIDIQWDSTVPLELHMEDNLLKSSSSNPNLLGIIVAEIFKFHCETFEINNFKIIIIIYLFFSIEWQDDFRD